MNLSPAYLQWREDTLQEGRQEGRQDIIKNLLIARFGNLDEALSEVVLSLEQLPPEEFAGVLLQLSNVSLEELLARCSSSRN